MQAWREGGVDVFDFIKHNDNPDGPGSLRRLLLDSRLLDCRMDGGASRSGG